MNSTYCTCTGIVQEFRIRHFPGLHLSLTGAAGDDNVGSDTRRSASSSQSEDEPETHHGTQIDANADSQITTIDGDASQSSDDGAASGVSKPALDFNTVFGSS